MKGRALVISVAPYNFAGAGAAHSQVLQYMARRGAYVQFWAPTKPFRDESLRSSGVKVIVSNCISDAYPNSDYVAYGIIAEGMIGSAESWLEACSSNRVIIYSSYLFPFCATSEMVSRALAQYGERVMHIVNPAGSDIWQIGRQMPSVVRKLIDSDHVDAVVTYSRRFAKEIESVTGSDRFIEVIPPIIDTALFVPISQEKRLRIRRELNIPDRSFVISHCSNHRPIKGVHHSFEIAERFASHANQEIWFLLIGPITEHLRNALHRYGIQIPENSTDFRARIGALHVICVGLQGLVSSLHAISDVAINTSLHDSFNISLAEAMACEVPVLTTDVAGISSIVRECGCGHILTFDYNPIYDDGSPVLASSSVLSPEAAVEWLVDIWKAPDKRRTIGGRGRTAIERHCSHSSVEGQWDRLCGFS